MKHTFKILALCAAAAAAGLAHADADQTKLYDPMSAAEKVVVNVDLLGKDGNTAVGQVVAVNTPYGVAFYPNLKGLTPGMHGFHVHQNPDCGATDAGLAMKAGGHWDPEKKGAHSFPWDVNGHKGDLPSLYVAADGTAVTPVLAPKIKTVDELKGHSVMIHVGGDNFHDHPAKLGGGGARLACGVIK